jgi:hypothetical protein
MTDQNYTQILSKEEYLALAEQCEQRAKSAKAEIERQGFLLRADLFRRLGNRRLEVNQKEAHFVGTLARARTAPR